MPLLKRCWSKKRKRFNRLRQKTISEIHSKAEKSLGLRAGTAASIRNGSSGGNSGGLSPGGLPGTGPGTGGMMPRMPGVRKMPGMPGLHGDNWEVQRSKSSHKGDASRMQNPIASRPLPINSKLLPQGSGGVIAGKTSALLQGSGGGLQTRPSNFVTGQVQPSAPGPSRTLVPVATLSPVTEKPKAASKSYLEEMHKKTVSLLEEYFHIRILEEAFQCVEELKSPAYYPRLELLHLASMEFVISSK